MALELQGLHQVPLSELRESESNPRSISDSRFDALKYALANDPEMLQARPLIAMPNGEVICGNMRLRAMKEMGWEESWAFVADLSPERKREWMVRDNEEYGDWVPDELAALIAEHKRHDGDMALLGLGEEKIDNLLATLNEGGDGTGDGGGGDPPIEMWGVIVECESEDDQAALLDELSERNYEVRALIT